MSQKPLAGKEAFSTKFLSGIKFDSVMSSILELPEARARAVRWSVEDYEQYGEMLADHGVLPKRAELIRGIIIEKMPKSALHVDLSKWIYDEFKRQLPPGHLVFQEGPLRLADSEPEPDVSVVQGTRAEVRTKHPTTALLVVEVAVSSVAMDREYASLYAEANVPEYWIILAEAQQVEVRRQPVNGEYLEQQTYRVADTLVCSSVLGLSVALAELFG